VSGTVKSVPLCPHPRSGKPLAARDRFSSGGGRCFAERVGQSKRPPCQHRSSLHTAPAPF